MEILIDPNGTLRMIYKDELAPLLEAGEAQVARASRVEPAPGGGWNVDLSPVGGPSVMGPYPLRAEALAAEVKWLEDHDIPIPK